MIPFENALPFLKVGFAFTLMLVGIRNRLGLIFSILSGALFLGLGFGMPLETLGQTAFLALSSQKFIQLLCIVAAILTLSGALEASGQSSRLMHSLSGYLTHPRLRLIFFPALIGLLPMPGGAIFSAPMVQSVSEKMVMSGERRALINYWFRHIWEVVWPMYPGIILTLSLADLSITEFISKTWPGVFAMLAAGWFCYLRPGVLPLPQIQEEKIHKAPISKVLYEGMPLLIAIIGSVSLEALIARYAPLIPMELGVFTALSIAGLCAIIQNSMGLKFLGDMFMHKNLWKTLGVIAAVFIFKDVMQDAGIVEAMATSGKDFALFSSAIILPFLVGFIAGINVAFVGATFPLLIGLLHALGLENQIVAYIVLATFSGFTGVMISPLHICFLLTCEFFDAKISTTWRKLIPPSLCLFATGVVLFFITR